MKGRYISIPVLMACRSKRSRVQQNIHEQLRNSIQAHTVLMRQWAQTFESPAAEASGIHDRLQETLAERRRLMRQWQQPATPSAEHYIDLITKQAA